MFLGKSKLYWRVLEIDILKQGYKDLCEIWIGWYILAKEEFLKQICAIIVFFLGFNLYFYGSLHIVSITSLLVLSIEWILRRYWMLCSDLWQKHWDSYPPTPLVFLGHISLHLSLSRNISSQIQPNSKCKYYYKSQNVTSPKTISI